ncbi:ATP-dependent helicase [Bradyrhizobium arachidis]|uniref:ATP-dependent helicase n=1 Tax=Bradyrhizobium TaxID=374 RepID=UPI0021629BE0|nr:MULTISPECIES: ATP-dependent helicase [Bradyrhizobium]MDN4986407.1 ATP-dependent helicase [Bradyrhizobium sp. WYCCWR 13022]UVO38256.1 ATP-dependent helicase [Bradyrhizobium arachidis]
MSVMAFEGPAGSGKTHRLMDELASELRARPLNSHQRVLALTFMHGSRRRLDARLRTIDGLTGRFEATTLDSFAWRLTQRFRRLVASLGRAIPPESEYSATCALAAALLERPVVRAWMRMSYPIIVVDEAQDLSPERSSMIAACASEGKTFLAFDEFQCLDATLLPISIETWLRNHCAPVSLTGCRRTSDSELLEAAHAVREGRALKPNGRKFKIIATPGHVNLAATCLANAIAWRQGGNVAVLTPSRQGGFAENAVARVAQGPVGRKQNGPFSVVWESNDKVELQQTWDLLGITDDCAVAEALSALAVHRKNPIVKATYAWLAQRRSRTGLETVQAAEVKRRLDRAISQRRHYAGRVEVRFAAMSIQQAKNREFDHVIVFWPYAVRAGNEQKRRLLYNAITRAKRSCTVLTQSAEMLRQPPFVP